MSLVLRLWRANDFSQAAWIAEWLAGVFMMPPSPAVIVNYRTDLGQRVFDALREYPENDAGILRMREAIETGAPAIAVSNDLTRAFLLMFEGIGGPETISLRASAHEDPTHSNTAGKIDILLQRAGVSLNAAFSEPSDHLCIELALLAQMMRRDAAYRDDLIFLRAHLHAWTGELSKRCHDSDRTGFYAGAASILTSFVAGLSPAYAH